MSDTGRIDEYLDGALSAGDAAAFVRATAADPDLKAHLDLRQGALALFHDVGREAPPARFRWLVEQRLRRRLRGRSSRGGTAGLAAELVAAAVLVLILAVCSVAMSPLFDPPRAVQPTRAAVPDRIRAELTRYGAIESVGLDPETDDLVVRFVVTPDQVDALRDHVARTGMRASGGPDRFGRVEIVVDRSLIRP